MPGAWIRTLTRALNITLVLCASASAQAAPPLGGYNVQPGSISVSGLSSGAFAAAQIAISYSSLIAGVGIFAGGTYDCAGQTGYPGCIYDASPPISESIARMHAWSGGAIDDVANIARQRIYLFTGELDSTVGQPVTDRVYQLYVTKGRFIDAGNVKYDKLPRASHTFPTDFDAPGDNACGVSAPPYVSNCGFDGAGAVLQWIYGALNPRNDGTLGGKRVAFDQTQFIGNGLGMDTAGWVFVPADCANNVPCRVHVVLHGCLQDFQEAGATFIDNAGYERWADTNDIILLYPQAAPDPFYHLTAASGLLPNPSGCWDWIGWYGPYFDRKAGVQMKAIVAMIDRLAGTAQAAR